mgnify:FL=1
MKKNFFKNQTIVIGFSIILGIFSIILGIGYAFYVFDITINDSNPIINVKTSTVDLKLTEVSGTLGLCKNYPISNAEGLACTPYIFSVQNSNKVDLNEYINLEVYTTSTWPASDVHIAFAECSDSACSTTTYTNKLLSSFTVNTDTTEQGVTGYILNTTKLISKNTTKYFKIIIWQDLSSTYESGTFNAKLGVISYNV